MSYFTINKILLYVVLIFCLPTTAYCQMQHEGADIYYNHDDGGTYWQDRDGNYHLLNRPGDGNDQDPPDPDFDYDDYAADVGGDWGSSQWGDFWDSSWDYWAWLAWIQNLISQGASQGDLPDEWFNQNFLCPTLISATEAKFPIGRDRTTLGIGEDFGVRVWNLCPGATTTFALTNSGGTTAIKIPNGSSSPEYSEFSAGYTPGTFSLRVWIENTQGTDCEECDATLDLNYTVIAPSGVYFEHAELQSCNQWQTDIEAQHQFNMPSTAYDATVYLQPDNVNFYNVEVKEVQEVEEDCGGTYWSFPPFGIPPSMMECREHNPSNGWAKMNRFRIVVPGKGTRLKGIDMIGHFWFCNDDFDHAVNAGFSEWKIEWKYKRVDENGQNEEEIKFCQVIQRADNILSSSGNNPEFVVSKGVLNATVGKVIMSTYLKDPTTCIPLGTQICQ